MKRATGAKSWVVAEADQLRREIQKRIDAVRNGGSPKRLRVQEPALRDGFWRAFVEVPRDSRAVGASARLLTQVEEEFFDEYGLNVVLSMSAR